MSGVSEACAGPTARIFGPVQFRDRFVLITAGVGVFLGSLSSGGRGVVDPCPTAHGVRGGKAKGVHDEVEAVGQARNGDGVMLADEAVGALLLFGGEVAVGQDVVVQDLVSTDVGGVEDRKG